MGETLVIAGAGVSGSYLASLLENEYEVTVYDGNKMRGCKCAWGCFHSLLKEQLDKIGLNVDDYVLCKTDTLILNGIPIKLRNEVNINKPKMLKDIYDDKRVVPKHLPHFHVTGADFVVNATAIPIGDYKVIPTKQFKTHIEGVEKKTAYVHIDSNYVGYAWVFPLDEDGKDFHLGAGCVNGDPQILIDMLEKRYKLKVSQPTCKCNRAIKVVNPSTITLTTKNIVSIGEAAGCVYPVTGEGIIPSMESANLLYRSLKNGTFAKGYEESMRTKILEEHKPAYKIWRLMEKHPRLALLLGFRYMYSRAKRRAMPVIGWGTKLELLINILLL